MLNENFYLELIDEQEKLKAKIEKVHKWNYKNKWLMVKGIKERIFLIDKALDGNVFAIKKLKKKDISVPLKMVDEYNNIFHVIWIDILLLDNLWIEFDEQYIWSMIINVYIKNLVKYINSKIKLKGFNIRFKGRLELL